MGRLKLSRLKGMRDLLPGEAEKWSAIEQAARRTFSSYGYGEIRTPILEPTELFARSVGEATDIVHKEMFTFTDKGGRSVTLRPENTAGVVRAVIENGLAQGPLPLRLFYIGPQYRYERPQKGRYREFRQIGVELFGIAGPQGDCEVLAMLFEFLRALGFEKLEAALNAVPTGEGRNRFTEALRSYAEPRSAGFGEDDRRRLGENPLRLFDSKDPETVRALGGAPRAAEFLDPGARAHHEEVRRLLDEGGIPNREDPALVRGLDYYTKTVFEVTSAGLGAQDAILGGGRYDHLVRDLGGPEIPAVGFAIGEDRLVDLVSSRVLGGGDRIFVVPAAEENVGYAVRVAARLRELDPGASVETDLGARGFSKGLRRAAQMFESGRSSGRNGRWLAVLVGPEEEAESVVTVKDLASQEQRRIAVEELAREARR